MMALVYFAFAAFFVDVALCQLPTYRNIDMDDVVFQHSLLFDQPVRSLLECATRCSKDDNCVTFTRVAQPSGDVSCRGHSAEMDSTSSVTSLELAKAKTFVMTDTKGKMDADECASNPCQNGGTCTDLVNSYTCTCTPKYSGNQCQTEIDPCNVESHTTLDNPERNMNTGVVNLGDNNLTAGWYRFNLNGQNAMIPIQTKSPFGCSSNTPLWLHAGGQSIPAPGNEVNVTACAGQACCCYISLPLIVHNCGNTFLVYYLLPPETVDAQYCAVPFPTI